MPAKKGGNQSKKGAQAQRKEVAAKEPVQDAVEEPQPKQPASKGIKKGKEAPKQNIFQTSRTIQNSALKPPVSFIRNAIAIV